MKNEFDVCLYVLESFASLAIQLAATACAARNKKQPLKRLKLQIDCQTLEAYNYVTWSSYHE